MSSIKGQDQLPIFEPAFLEFLEDLRFDCDVDALPEAREDLLVPIFRRGQLVYQTPSLEQVRQRVQQQLAMLHPGVRRFVNPHQYPAGLELGLQELKTKLVLAARGES